MKVFNITDSNTNALVSRGLANQALKVGETVIPAGKSAELRGTAREMSELQVYLRVGAVALDELPPAYASRRGLHLDGSPLAPEPTPAPVNAPSDQKMLGTEPAPEETTSKKGSKK